MFAHIHQQFSITDDRVCGSNDISTTQSHRCTAATVWRGTYVLTQSLHVMGGQSRKTWKFLSFCSPFPKCLLRPSPGPEMRRARSPPFWSSPCGERREPHPHWGELWLMEKPANPHVLFAVVPASDAYRGVVRWKPDPRAVQLT